MDGDEVEVEEADYRPHLPVGQHSGPELILELLVGMREGVPIEGVHRVVEHHEEGGGEDCLVEKDLLESCDRAGSRSASNRCNVGEGVGVVEMKEGGDEQRAKEEEGPRPLVVVRFTLIRV